MPDNSESRSGSAAGARRLSGSPRVMAVGAVAFAAIAVFHPESWPLALLGFLALLGACILPERRTRRMRLRQEARRRRNGLWPEAGIKAAMEAMPEPAFVIDRHLALRYRNGAAGRAFGGMALGDPISLRFRSPEVLAAIERAVADAEAETALYVERARGARSWQIRIAPIPPLQGETPRFFLLLFSDRTSEQRTERMRTDFVANASHELRTPLASLTGFIETLQGPARDDAAARKRFLAIMSEQAARMSRLIDDLLSLSRVEMQRHVPIDALADLVRILSEVREQMTPLANDLGVTIAFEAPPDADAFRICGEHDQLTQVFSNLVENACKYGSSGGRVVLSLDRGRERRQAFVDASVTDFGPGIAPEHVPRLTERFYRVDIGSSRAKQGTGLGLSIVRNILIRHKARLLVTSELGRGSTFTARFPELGKN